MMGVAIEYRDEDTETVFRWHGGAYIDVGFDQRQGREAGDSFEALDVINVWNDELDESCLESEVEIQRMAGAYVRRYFLAILERFEDECRSYLARGRAGVEA